MDWSTDTSFGMDSMSHSYPAPDEYAHAYCYPPPPTHRAPLPEVTRKNQAAINQHFSAGSRDDQITHQARSEASSVTPIYASNLHGSETTQNPLSNAAAHVDHGSRAALSPSIDRAQGIQLTIGTEYYPNHRGVSLLIQEARTRLNRRRLEADLHRLPDDVQVLATTILEGSSKLKGPPVDVYEEETGVCWWNVAADGSKQLFNEGYQLCVKYKAYFNRAPFDVQEMVETIKTSNEEVKRRAAQVSMSRLLAEEAAWDKAARKRWEAEQADQHSRDSSAEISPLERPVLDQHPDGALPNAEMPVAHLPAATGKSRRPGEGLLPGIEPVVEGEEDSPDDDFEADQPQKKRLKMTGSLQNKVDPPATQSPKGKARAEDDSKSKKPRKAGNLDPGKKYFRWPAARLRIYRQVLGYSEQEIPPSAVRDIIHELESNCTPGAVDPRLCNFDLSIEEILTYFPMHSLWREMCWRILRHWPASKVIAFIYWARNLRHPKAVERSTLQHRYREARFWAQVKEKTKMVEGQKVQVTIPPNKLSAVADPSVKGNMSALSTVSGLTGSDDVDPFDYFVWDLAQGVDTGRYPTGKGAQLLTRVIKHVREVTRDRNLRLSEVEAYARTHGIIVPVQDRLGADIAAEDLAALKRHGDHVTKFYADRFGHNPE